MAERLTDRDYFAWHYTCGYQNKKDSLDRTQKEHKLGNLEDMLEKYSIESIEMLEQELKIAREIERLKNKEFDLSNSAIVDKDFYKDFTRDIEKLEADRATWKRACELACNYMCKFVIPCPDIHKKECENICDYDKARCYQEYFYQQAKKEGDSI